MSGVLVVLEQESGRYHRGAWEAAVAASVFGLPVDFVTFGAAGEAGTKAARTLYTVENPAMATYDADGYTDALEQLIRQAQPAAVVFAHTYQARDYAPRVATRFGQELVSDVVRLRKDGDRATAVRQLFQGKLSADYAIAADGPAFLSIQAGSYRGDTLESGTPEVRQFAPQLGPNVGRVRAETPFRDADRGVDLTTANVIVSVGRGIREQENLPVVEELAEVLGAEMAASRPICDNGWMPMERQVGSSGQTVAPKLYLAVGISGAIQHQVGMKGSKTIAAINSDPDAPIFEVADYAAVGDLFEIVPELVKAIRERKG